MVVVALLLFGLSILVSIAESYYERDWPRSTFKFVILFGLVVIASLQ